jgi:hypothetical protein
MKKNEQKEQKKKERRQKEKLEGQRNVTKVNAKCRKKKL